MSEISHTTQDLTSNFIQVFKNRGFEGRTFNELAKEMAQLAPTVMDHSLTRRLHEAERHPDYEYTSIEHQRKTCVENTPEGHGWEVNKDLDDGVTRDDHTEDHHYRRLKSDARKDTIPSYTLPKLTLDKITLTKVLDHLRGIWNETRFVGGRGPSTEYYSKFEYTHHPESIFCAIESGFFAYSWEAGYPSADDPKYPFVLRDYNSDGPGHKPYLVLCLPGHPFRLLIDTKEPEGRSFISVERKDGSPGPWERLALNSELPINPAVLNQEAARL